MVSGRRDPLAGVRLGAGRPERPHRLDRRLEQVEPLGRRREGQPERRVLALPPAGADADERAPAGEHVERRRRLRDDARRPEGHRRAQRAQPQPGVEPGEQAEGHPRLRDRLPGAVRPAGSGSGGPSAPARRSPPRPRPAPSRAARPPGPRPTGTARAGGRPRAPGRRDAGRSPPRLGRRRRRRRRSRVGAGRRRGRGPSPRRRASADGAERAAAGRPGPRAGTGPVARGVAARGTRLGGVSTRRRPPAARRPAPRPSQARPAPAPGRGCRRPWSARGPAGAATIGSRRANASAEASRSCGPLPTTPRRSSDGHGILLAAVVRDRPRWTCPNPRRRRGRQCGIGQGHEDWQAAGSARGALDRAGVAGVGEQVRRVPEAGAGEGVVDAPPATWPSRARGHERDGRATEAAAGHPGAERPGRDGRSPRRGRARGRRSRSRRASRCARRRTARRQRRQSPAPIAPTASADPLVLGDDVPGPARRTVRRPAPRRRRARRRGGGRRRGLAAASRTRCAGRRSRRRSARG